MRQHTTDQRTGRPFGKAARALAAGVTAACLLAGLAAAGDDPAPKETAEQKERLESMKRQAAAYEVTLDTVPPTRLSLHGEPLLRFTNPVGGVTDGVVAMWKEGERPAVFAQIFQIKDGGLWLHECQSVASAGLSMQAGGVVKWHPEQAAGIFRPLPGAPRAADSVLKRLVQMKALAGRFSASDDFRVNPADPKTSRYQLRLLTTPAYRYQDAQLGVKDGAVFAFGHGTDPEVFLILEHRGDGDKGGWFYALAPMTCWGVQAKLDGSEVWSVPERHGKTTADSPYHIWAYRPEK